ncbi:lysophospholipid acyltransferase family protein [Ectothiorhodospira lacustris]|uniref:lysophospholipid acyltransferase family protein n=1 Tax=Ectothiorhodospira lacustris TaxID=2899127 RepID=UPI001EE93FA8|nr:lipid A biosynthesis acyltransferase [Ectothiorhodospira lacustris]MCG5500715.1 lipid A biosynthesis acyltransferase [Ectothiorhodospira lacustris]MCG5509066.1 lipid A biosynthesis acyltransferase [Ectothiorhodospira lacustris]MCG5520857.1 lipid A biosynthesis acyltransferase [Ectothiorhodospira lacustris]
MEPLIRLLFSLLARMPLRANHALGALLGWLAWVLRTEPRRISLLNLATCFPERDARWHQKIARQSLMETGKALTEAPWLWHAGSARVQALLAGVEGEEHLQSALTQGRGAFLVSPHLGSWEFAGLHAAGFGTMTSLFRPPRLAALNRPLREARAATGARLVPTTLAGIKEIQRAVSHGGLIGMLPDQTPKGARGIFAPFFGHPALTMTLLNRLAGPRQVPIVFAFAQRLPAGKGYRYRCIPVPETVYAKDPQVAACAVNEAVETLIRLCPEQYVWSYKRFAARPPGAPRVY